MNEAKLIEAEFSRFFAPPFRVIDNPSALADFPLQVPTSWVESLALSDTKLGAHLVGMWKAVNDVLPDTIQFLSSCVDRTFIAFENSQPKLLYQYYRKHKRRYYYGGLP